MKLRTLENSVRLRLSQTEVAQIGDQQSVCVKVGLPAGNALTYELCPSKGSLDVALADDRLVIQVPGEKLVAWAHSNEVGLEEHLELPNDDSLRLLIEKDFACLKPRDGEDESDLYPHPDPDTAQC